jgi:parallel beta-helix repeat protein
MILSRLKAALLLALCLQIPLTARAAEVLVPPGQNPAITQNQCRSLPPGSTIRLMPGRHALPLQLSELHGSSQAPIHITAEPQAFIDGWQDKAAGKFGHGSGILLEKSSFVVVEGLSISGFERGITIGGCQSVTLKANIITDVSNYGIMSYMSDGTAISENRIERSYLEHGIYVSGAGKQIIITKNIIRDTHINGIHVNGAVAGPVIADNTLERTGSFPSKEGGAALTLLGGTTSPVVTNNHLKNIYGQGITVDAPNAVIRGNSFESCAWSSILGLPQSLNLHLAGNVFQDSKVVPLQLSGTIIPSLTAAGDHFATTGPVCQENESHKSYHLKDWQGIGKDDH